MALYKVYFEEVGYLDNDSAVNSEVTEHEAMGFTEQSVKEGLFPANIVGVTGGYITADDAQGDCDIRCFVRISLIVQADSLQQANRMTPPVDLLTKVLDMLVQSDTPVSFEAEDNWAVVDVTEIELAEA
ncbi:MAG: hypothetical protein Q7U16_14305 [Agitococcus sp.]|nr:hypothetical protein [Agitococcus sp.]